LSGPARAVACQALGDIVWQAQARTELVVAAQRLSALLAPLGEVAGTALFATLSTPNAAALFEHFARRAILLRRFDAHALLRVGLPGTEAEWQRLEQAIAEWKPPC
jgi:cobalamin biosynthetic protein CobC